MRTLPGLAALCLVLGFFISAQPGLGQEVIYTYDDTTAGAIPRNSLGLDVNGATAASCNGSNPNALVRTFTVPDSFTVAGVAVGLNIAHPTRDELAAVLRSPAGTTVSFLNDGATNGSGDSENHYDILVATGTEGSIRDGDEDDLGPPYFHREVTDPTDDNLGVFTGQGSAGTWTLYVCDENNDGQTGTLNRARLVLTESAAATPVCASTVTYDWGANGNDQPFTSVTVGGITWTESATQDVFGNALAGADFVTRVSQQGGEAGYYALGFDADPGDNPNDGDANESGALLATFTFDPPVRDLAFDLLDIDASGWEDLVRVEALGPDGDALPVQASPVDAGAIDRHGDLFEADASAAPTADTSNVQVFIPGPVATLTVTYMTGDSPTNPNSQYAGISDFVLCGYDFGDAPDSYDTGLGAGAARHGLARRELFLGSAGPDGEADGQPVAAGADNNGASGDGLDEDGVTAFPATSLSPGDTYSVAVRATNATGAAAQLCGWVDFDLDGGVGDGTFESDEGSCVTVPAAGGNASCSPLGGDAFECQVDFTVPADFTFDSGEPTYARFRVASAGLGVASPAGGVEDGEVEDYQIPAGTLPITLAWFQAGGAGLVEWQTATETANAGFRLVGLAATGEARELALVASRVVSSRVPQAYAARVDLEGIEALLLEDIDLRGTVRPHGPFAIGPAYGALEAARTIDWAAIRAELELDAELSPLPRGPSPWPSPIRAGGVREARLAVTEPGIQVVTHEDLVAAGVDLAGIPASHIALLDEGAPLARFIEGEATFGPGSAIEFVLPEPLLTLESPADLVVLTVDRNRAVSPRLQGPPRRPSKPVVSRQHRAFRPDSGYSFASPTGDPWYDQQVVARGPASVTRSFDLPHLGPGAVELTVELWGGADFPGVDHHAVLRLNGQLLGEALFDGFEAWTGRFPVEGRVAETGNLLEIEVPNDRGNPFDVVTLEGFEVEYPAGTAAVEGRWSGEIAQRLPFVIGDLPAGPAVSWRRDGQGAASQAPGQGWSRILGNGPTLTVKASRNGVTWVSALSRRARPTVRIGVPPAAAPSRAPYLVVTHPAFAGHLGDLVALQESRGLEVDLVTTEAIYAGGSDHAPDAEALRRYIAGSEARFVLLVGTASYDPHDHLGLGSISLVPTVYRRVNDIVAFAPSDAALADADGDGLPDRAIGRLPVRTAAELDALVAKLRDWSLSTGQGGSYHGTALLTSGRSDRGRDLAVQNEAYGAALGEASAYSAPAGGWSGQLAAVDDLGSGAVRSALLEALGEAPRSLISFVGHSSFGRWDFDPVLTWQDPPSLTNRGQPAFVTQWGCWTSYFVAPNLETISDHLLLTPEVGAMGVIGATTLTSTASHERLGQLFFEALAGQETFGEAFLAAKRRLAAEGGGEDAIDGMVLLGDPATPIRP